MIALVTGGAGFIGSHLVRELLRRNHQVRVLDNFSTGHRSNLTAVLGNIELIEGDIRDADAAHTAMKGVDWVFHKAALPSVPRSIEDPVTSAAVNFLGTTQVLKAAVDCGVRRVVYAASSSAYGNLPDAAKQEDKPPQPLSPYAVSKLAGEYMLKAFTQCYGIETIGLRYFNVFGERQDPNSPYSGVIAKFCRLMLNGEAPVIYGDGQTARDFTYVANVVQANLLAVQAEGVSGRIINVACGTSISLLELVRQLNQILGTDFTPTFGPNRLGDIKHSCADITYARELLGYRPLVDFASGLRRAVSWYREQATGETSAMNAEGSNAREGVEP